MKRTLGIFAKQPVPGAVKTRLAAETSPAFAAQVAKAFLLDTLDRFQGLQVRRVLAYSPVEALPFFQHVAGSRYELVPQTSGDLGARMAAFFQQSFAQSQAAVLLGTDSPTLPVTFVAEAFAELAHADLVLGPCTDGGYYLIGCTRQLPAIFDGIDWGTPRVLEQTIERLRTTSTRLALLAPWYDVDTLADLQSLRGHVTAMRRAGIDPGIPRTEVLLTQFPSPPHPNPSPPEGRGAKPGQESGK